MHAGSPECWYGLPLLIVYYKAVGGTGDAKEERRMDGRMKVVPP